MSSQSIEYVDLINFIENIDGLLSSSDVSTSKGFLSGSVFHGHNLLIHIIVCRAWISIYLFTLCLKVDFEQIQPDRHTMSF